MTDRISQDEINAILWKAYNILRSTVNAFGYAIEDTLMAWSSQDVLGRAT